MERLQTIDRLDAIRVISEPHRLVILRHLLARPHTISSLGQLLDKHPAWVRHHVKALEDAGVVALVETRTTRNYTEKYYRGTAAAFTISMLLRPDTGAARSLVALVSDDRAIAMLAEAADERSPLAAMVTGSLDGLIGVRQGMADIAGCHLLDADTGEYNVPYVRHIFPDRDVMVVTVSHREQGLIVPAGNPLGLQTMSDVVERGARLARRNRGSGTQLWIDRALATVGAQEGPAAITSSVYNTHGEAAEAVASGAADVALGIASAALQLDLGFVPLFRERYDLVMSDEIYRTEEAARLIDRLHTKRFRDDVGHITGYDSSAMGDEYRVAV